MVKNSFTLFETLLSITLLTFVVSGFLNSTYYDNINSQNYMTLNSLENKFDTNNYTGFNKSSTNLKIIKNNSEIEFISVSKYSYENENIKLIKYEK